MLILFVFFYLCSVGGRLSELRLGHTDFVEVLHDSVFDLVLTSPGDEGLCTVRKGVDSETTEVIVLGEFDDVAVDLLQCRKR